MQTLSAKNLKTENPSSEQPICPRQLPGGNYNCQTATKWLMSN